MRRPPYNPHNPFDVLSLRLAIESLPETDRAIARMIMADCTQTEIASALGYSQRGVGKRIGKLARIRF